MLLTQVRSILVTASLLSALALPIPSTSVAATNKAPDGTICDDSILDIGGVASQPGESKSDAKRAKRWETARADYERDLDFATIDRRQLPQDYNPLRDVIEAKYQLALAEGQLTVPNFDKKAVSDLQQAQGFLAHALQHGDAQDKPKFNAIKGKVDRILQFVTHGGGCWSEHLSAAFDNVDYYIEQVLHGS